LAGRLISVDASLGIRVALRGDPALEIGNTIVPAGRRDDFLAMG